jgi:hypothetical protein
MGEPRFFEIKYLEAFDRDNPDDGCMNYTTEIEADCLIDALKLFVERADFEKENVVEIVVSDPDYE